MLITLYLKYFEFSNLKFNFFGNFKFTNLIYISFVIRKNFTLKYIQHIFINPIIVKFLAIDIQQYTYNSKIIIILCPK